MSRCLLAFALIILLVPWTASANPERTFLLPGGAEIEMVWIEPGTFMMGSSEDEPGRQHIEGPQHEVTITRGFWLGKYELTKGQWESVMGTTPWAGHSYFQPDANYPAQYISWETAQEFVGKLNEAEGSEIYRLPTEAEWEYACRAGTETSWPFGDDESLLGQYAWYYDNTTNIGAEYPHAVGTNLPNPWGLYDMHGNVQEWCQDLYGAYASDPQTDPQGVLSGSSRVLRGGGFSHSAPDTRSAKRHSSWYGSPSYRFGTRLLRTGPAPDPTTISPTFWGEVKSRLR